MSDGRFSGNRTPNSDIDDSFHSDVPESAHLVLDLWSAPPSQAASSRVEASAQDKVLNSIALANQAENAPAEVAPVQPGIVVGPNGEQTIREQINGFDVTSVLRPDGSVETRVSEQPDGSTISTRYFPMTVEAEGGEQHTHGPGEPEEQTIVWPDGSSEYRRYSHDGHVELFQNSRGDTTTFVRQAEGVLRGAILNSDGSRGFGYYNDNLEPIFTSLDHPDGSNEVRRPTEDGYTSRVTRPDGTQVITRASNRALEITTQHADGSQSRDNTYRDQSRTLQRFGPNGETLQSITIPAPGEGRTAHLLENGGIEIQVRASEKNEINRVVTTDPIGRIVSEESRFPGGVVREQITYDHDAGTRTVSTFNNRGERIRHSQNERMTVLPVLD